MNGNIFFNIAMNVLGIVLLLVLRLTGRKRHFQKKALFLINAFMLYFVIRMLSVVTSTFDVEYVSKTLYLAEALILAFALIKTLMFVFIDFFLLSKKDVEVPKIIQDTLFVLFYFILLMLVLKGILDINLTSILTTSAVLTMVLGLALQDNLGNLFSGLAIQIEKPFSIGEWVQFAGTIGKVKGLSWRSVKLLTLENDLLVIPNSKIIQEPVVNFNRPTHHHISRLEIGVAYDHPPNMVKNVIISLLQNEPDVSSDPKPSVMLISYGDFAITYEIRYYITNFNRFQQIKDSINTKLWYAFERNGIRIPFPIRNLYMHNITDKKEKFLREDELRRLSEMLKAIDFLSLLDDKEISMLALSGRTLNYSTGETVIKEGDDGDSLFLILKGEVDVSVRADDGETRKVASLGECDFFGERSLMTGEKRNATVTAVRDCVLFTINKDNFKSVISNHTDTLKQISEILSRRELELKAKREETTKRVTNTQIKENSIQILNRIMRFLGF